MSNRIQTRLWLTFRAAVIIMRPSGLCVHQAGFEQIEVGAAVHLAFDEFQSGDLTFDLTA